MVKHTPGPWRVLGIDQVFARVDDDTRADSASITIARLSGTLTEASQELQANARLIAAAPEMLDGLKQALEQLRGLYASTPLDGAAALLRKLDAVVAKAEGTEEKP